jgi:L-aspartate oxidase
MAELAPRDVVARAIVNRIAETGADHVWLDTRHLGGDFLRKRFPTINERLLEHGIDMATELIPVAPAQHYHSGGVVADLVGRTSVPGLYAVGEVACTGVHGANRLASNSLLEGLVFATRAARHIAARVADGSLPQLTLVPRPGPAALVTAASRARVQRIASDGPGVLRSGDGLRAALAALDRVPTDAYSRRDDGRLLAAPQVAEWETTNIHQVATALTYAALLREESRGGHARTDFPATDDAWRVRLDLALDPTGHLAATRTPIG